MHSYDPAVTKLPSHRALRTSTILGNVNALEKLKIEYRLLFPADVSPEDACIERLITTARYKNVVTAKRREIWDRIRLMTA